MQSVISIRKVSFLFLIASFMVSCRVTLVPEYSAELEDQITNTAKATDRLYIDILDAPANDRDYRALQGRYNDIEAEINSIELKNQGRIKNGDFIEIIKNLKGAFLEAKNYHKEHKTLSNGEAISYRATLAGFWKPLYLAERALRINSN